MDLYEIIFGIIPLGLWVIFGFIDMFKKIRKTTIEKNKDIPITVKCRKCGNEHNITIEQFLSAIMVYSKSVSVSVLGTSVTHYNVYAKRFYCPTCNKKTWSEVKDHNSLSLRNSKFIFPVVITCLAKITIVGFLIVVVSLLILD